MDIFKPKEELIKEKESEELVKYLSAKNNIMNVIGMDGLIKEISDIIDKSEVFTFRSEMARYVDEFNPVFIIKYIEHSNQGASNDSLEALYSESTINKVYDEIIAPSGELIYEKVDESKIMEEMDSLEKDLTALLLSNMFGISVGKSTENIIHLRLIL